MENFKDWQDSGRCYTRKAFLKINPTAELKGACDDVMLYDSGHYIQGLFDGTWYECNTNRSKYIEEVEKNLFLEKVEKKID
jgi:hypothetical protein